MPEFKVLRCDGRRQIYFPRVVFLWFGEIIAYIIARSLIYYRERNKARMEAAL
jgi:hypothetical protein